MKKQILIYDAIKFSVLNWTHYYIGDLFILNISYDLILIASIFYILNENIMASLNLLDLMSESIVSLV
jgi:hypothetical protein